MLVSVVVPVFRSVETLRSLHARIASAFAGMKREFELILVEDAGGDGSWEIIAALSQEDARVQGIQLSRNSGQHNALLCGIRQARGEVIVTLDDDLQNPPEEISKLLAKLEEGFDMVYGTPQSETHGYLRDQASRITKWVLQGPMGAETAAKVSAFRAFRTCVSGAFRDFHGPSVNIDVLLTWGARSFTSVVVRQDKRTCGRSGYTARRLICHALNMITGFSTLPLRIASVLGFVFALFGLFVLAYVGASRLLHGRPVPGFTFLASALAIFSGVQLFALGIIGEYLARMYVRSMDRPAYVVRSRTSSQ